MDNSQVSYFQITYDSSDLIDCQIKQFESLMQNLSKIQHENLPFFPQNINFFHMDDKYNIKFLETNPSQLKKSQLMQHNGQPFHYGKRLLKLLVGLKKYNIYLPTLSQESFATNQQESMLSNQTIFQKQVAQYILLEFGLDNLANISANLKDYHCLSPEFINQIKNPLISNEQIEFTEKMSIFNVGCILFELKTSATMYYYQNNFEETINNSLWQNIFHQGFNYQNYRFGLLIQKCLIIEEFESNRRPTFEEALSELEYIEECEQIIQRAQAQMKSIDIHQFFSLDSNLQEQLNQVMQFKICHQITGRLFILQNLARIKFIYNVFQKKYFMYFRDFLMIQLIIKEIQQVQKLQQEPQNIQQIDLRFMDSVDEIREFKQIYSQKYIDLLYQLIKSISVGHQQINQTIQEQKYFQDECKGNNQLDYSIHFHSNLIEDNTIQSKLHKICLQNILTVFDFHQLNLNFKPIFLRLTQQDHYSNIYDKLLQFLFDKDGDQTQFKQVIQAIQTNLIL